MTSQDQGAKKSKGDMSQGPVTKEQGRVDADQHGWAPDVGQADAETFSADRSDGGTAQQDGPPGPGARTAPAGVGTSRTRSGEDIGRHSDEPGRHDVGTKGDSDRPVGVSGPRAYTGVNPLGPIDKDSPTLQTP